MKILIIGGGNMGLTYAQAFLRSSIVDPSNLYVLERSAEKASQLEHLNLGTIYSSSGEWVGQPQIIVLAVKPQDFDALCPTIAGYLNASQLVLSIMAGVKLSTIRQRLQLNKIIRAMPNLPAQTGAGMTVFTATEEVSRPELTDVNNLLSSTGKTIYVEKESMIDAATAISGSGPAYVFYVMQALTEEAVALGFSPSEARLLVSQTFAGATSMLRAGKLSCQEWIGKVTSRGGTTEAAINAMEAHQIADHFREGVRAAYDRAVLLGEKA